jgi:hypothetical protein
MSVAPTIVMPPFLVEGIADKKNCDDRLGNLIMNRLIIF